MVTEQIIQEYSFQHYSLFYKEIIGATKTTRNLTINYIRMLALEDLNFEVEYHKLVEIYLMTLRFTT